MSPSFHKPALGALAFPLALRSCTDQLSILTNKENGLGSVLIIWSMTRVKQSTSVLTHVVKKLLLMAV